MRQLSLTILSLTALAACAATSLPTADFTLVADGLDTPNLIQFRSNARFTDDTHKTIETSTLDRPADSSWNSLFCTQKGVLKPSTRYRVEFTIQVTAPEGANGFMHFLCRPISDPTAHQDTFRMNVGPTATPTRQTFTFVTGPLDDYAFQVHCHNRCQAIISDFRILEAPADRFVSIHDNPTPFTETLDNLPTGAAEFTVEPPKPASNLILKATDFGFSTDNDDNAAAINKALDACRAQNAAGLELAPGTYRCESNTFIRLTDFKDFTLDGKGAKLVGLRTWNQFLHIGGCERTVVRNLDLDWNWDKDPLASLVEVAAVHDGSFDFRFVHYDTFPRRDIRMSIISSFDPKTRSVGIEGSHTRVIGSMSGPMPKVKYEWLSGNLLRIHEQPGALKPGQLYRFQHYYYHYNCITMHGNSHLSLENINILSTPGHAMVVSGPQHHWQYLNVNIRAPQDDPKRVITCTADHCHIANSKGFFKMVDCEFSLGADDCLNVHDNSGFARKTGTHSITTQNARSFGAPKPGTFIELRQGDYSPANFRSRIVAVKDIDAAKGIREFTFEDPVPDQTHDGFIMFNGDYDSHNVILRNCFFHDNRARGILLLARDITVENCRFRHPEMGAIKIETGYTFNVWSEGYGARNIVVRNCTFESVNPTNSSNDGKARDVYIGVYMKQDPSSERTLYPILADILFENNTFTDTYGLIAFISSAGNVTFRNNTFRNVTPRKKNLDYRAGFHITHAQNIRIVNNTYIDSTLVPKPGLTYDPTTSQNIVLQGNRVVRE